MRAWIYKAVFLSIVKEAAKRIPLETGGCLMGYWWHEYKEVVITHAIGPGPKAIHKMYSFRADFEWQQDRIHKIYHGSSRRITYLGDWHTHIGGGRLLSWKDLRALRKISQCKPARAPFPLMGILHDSDELTFDVWQYEPLTRLKVFPSGRTHRMQIEFVEDDRGLDEHC